jgi:Skp family chaperone for outer membrane proteins
VKLPVVRTTTLNQQGVLNVRTFLRLTTILASLLTVLLGAQAGLAQGTARVAPRGAQLPAASNRAPAPTTHSQVVVIDIGYIFRHHDRFKQMMENMKGDLQKAEQEFEQMRQKISDMVTELKRFNPGTPDYNSREEQITEAQLRLQAEIAKRKKEIVQQEARIYFMVYQEIEQQVRYFAERNGINLVLRYNSEDIDPANPNSVMKGVNRTVVYQRRVNITLDILAGLVGDRQAQPPTGNGGAQPYSQPRTTPSVSQGYRPVSRQ